MGNEQSVPAPPAQDSAKSQHPAIAAGDATRDPPNDVTEPADIDALTIETDNVKFHDGLPTPPATFDHLPTEAASVSSSAPIGIPRQNTETRDKRPAFLRRLTTAPSAVLTAQTHAENVTATPTSPSPETVLKSVAKEQLNTVSSPRSGSATNPSIKDKESYFPSPYYASEAKEASPKATQPPDLGSDNKELAQSLSSFQPSERELSERAHWGGPRSGSVSPLSCDLVSNGPPELHNQERDGAESQMTGGIPTPPRETAFDEARPVAFSVDDWAWRMEFLPSEASDNEDDIDPEFFPLPDGDDESFADDELSFLDPGRESALRGESRNEDHGADLAPVRTTSSAESTQRAASLHVVHDQGADAEDASSRRDAMIGNDENEVLSKTDNEGAPEETEVDACIESEHVKPGTNLEAGLPETETAEEAESEEQGHQDQQSDVDEQVGEQVGERINERINEQIDEQIDERIDEQIDEQTDERMDKQINEQTDEQLNEQLNEQIDEQSNECEETSAEVNSQKESSITPESPCLDASQLPAQNVIESDNRRDSAMYPLSLESPKDMEQLQTIKEPEPADRGKRMSLDSIEGIAGEPSMADLDSAEAKFESNLSHDEPPTREQAAEAATSDEEGESVVKQPANDGPAAESQPAEVDPIKDQTQENTQPEATQIASVAPIFKILPNRDNLPAADQRPATALPSRVAAETDSRPLTAPSNPLQASEGVPVRENSKSWRKTWPILGNRPGGSKSEASHAERDPDEILPATPVQPQIPEPAQQAQADGSEQRKAPVNDHFGTPGKTPGLVSKIPTPAEQSKTKEKKKRGSILGSIFRHSSTKDEKSKTKDSAKPEKNKEKESKPGKKNSKIAKVYRRSSKRQEVGEDEIKESPKSLSRPVTAMAILDTHTVEEPQSLEQNDAKTDQGNEGILKDSIDDEKGGSAGRGVYGLPSASLGIPTLLQSPAKKKQNHFPEGSWYHRRSAPPQEQASSAVKLPRRASMGIFAGPDSAEGKRVQGSHLPQARPAQTQNRRASVHVPPSVNPLRANPLLPPPDDSPYARATTGIPQPGTSKIFSYPNRNPPYRGIARTNSSTLHGIASASQPQVHTPRAGPSRIPSPNSSQVPVGRRNVAPRLPGPHRAGDVRRGTASPTFSQAGLGLASRMHRTPEGSIIREHHDTIPEMPLKGAGVAISSPQSATRGVAANSATSEQSFVAELADTDVGRRGSEEVTMRATSYPGMEWVPDDM